MQRISSANYPLTRLIVPHLLFLRRRSVQVAVLGLVVMIALCGLWLFLLPLLLPIILLVAIHQAPNFVFRNFCKDVWLGDGELVLQLKENTLRIPLAQVQSVSWHGSNNPPRVRVTVASTDQTDQVFTFVPDLTHGRSHAKALIETLFKNKMLVR